MAERGDMMTSMKCISEIKDSDSICYPSGGGRKKGRYTVFKFFKVLAIMTYFWPYQYELLTCVLLS